MKDELIAIIAEFLDVPPESLEEHMTLDDLKIDSLDFIEIMFEVEEKFDAPVISEIQHHKNEIHNLGDVLRFTEDLIVKHQASESVQDHA